MFNHETFKQTDTSFNNIYLAVVENNTDPQEAGKVQVRIAGLHTPEKIKTDMGGIPTSELPWALPMVPIVGGGVSGLGLNGVPRQGDWVAIFFVGGDHNHPVYMGVIKGKPVTAPDSATGFNDPAGVYPETLDTPDWNANSNTIKAEKNANLETFEPASVADPTYPHNTVLETSDDGIFVEYDSTPSKERWHVYHKASKSYIEINTNGDMVLKSTNNKFEITTKDRKIFIGGDDTKEIGGALSINVTGNATINAPVVQLNGSSSGNIVSPSVNLGDVSGGKKLMNEDIITIFNNHKHSGGGNAPTISMSTAEATSKTKAT